MQCNNCSVTAIKFEIKLEGKTNLSALQTVIDHLERRGIEISSRGDKLQMDEVGAREFLDFCSDLLDVSQVVFRINQEAWQPLDRMAQVFETEWIDDVIANERLTCHYQPIVDTDENIFAYEMLARFQNEDGSMIYPNEIFPAAKTRGRLYALDRVCRMTAVKYSAALKGEKAFINFIPTSIYSPEFCLSSTISLSKKLGVDPKLLVFEVVETEKVDDLDHLKKILTYYRERGFDYALDDVGEGYSTIEMLADMKPKYMKLDMKFVQDVATDLEKQRVAKKFLRKALEIGSIPLAEGIETRQDFEWLKQSGYQLFQGYYFGKPAALPLYEQHVKA
ncbi:diguanylate phosphodiesterase [Planococcus antarcticus DSM 14505]|uniref:Diguanylate phosphodiesterase n=1 Tax=Planococcus antarcticus DSM 14505 TaxID=1185653 RepID=A0A1C7DDD9_9BACL|nr:EAL domain-containing protein [Planococcus antarcticus]ANU09465.1 diguanylate phosphodiesterase [Planococcus antarcticus DSM 14505]EIM06238.1 diguanylate phosphodiesterase [Planococcus antarcticus DSM 14505]